MGKAEDLIGQAEVVNISSIFGGTEPTKENESIEEDDMPKPNVSQKAANLIGEAEANAMSKLFGKDDDETDEKPEDKPDDTPEEKPDKSSIDNQKQVASLNWIQGCIDEALDDVKDERRPELEDKVWLKLLKNKIGDGETSDATKKGIMSIVSAVLGGRADSLPDEEIAPGPVDMGTLGMGSRVVVNNESNDIFIGEVRSVRGSEAVIDLDEGGTITVPISDVTELDLDDGVLESLMDDDLDVESLIDRMT